MSPVARTLGLTLLLATALVSRPGEAQTAAERADARQHANAGRQHFEAGELDEAIASFEQAEAIIHAPPHLLYIARSHRRAGRLLKARDVYRQLVAEELSPRSPPPFREAIETGASELEQVDAKIPKLTIAVSGPESGAAEVTVDGKPAGVGPLEVDPGEHRVAATAEGFHDGEQLVTVGLGGEVIEVTLSLEPVAAVPAPPPAPDDDGHIPIPPIVLLGAGAAFVVVGAVTGGMALGKAGDLRDACPSNPCPTENQGLADDANLLATLSTIGLVVGGLALAGGATWLVLDLTSGEDGGETALHLGPGSLTIDGRF